LPGAARARRPQIGGHNRHSTLTSHLKWHPLPFRRPWSCHYRENIFYLEEILHLLVQ
jgi:hypothetical protein